MFRATIKNLFSHKLRLALTAVSVILGVSFMAGTYVLTDTIKQTFDTLFTQTAVGKDVEVCANSALALAPGKTPPRCGQDALRPPVPESLVSDIRRIPGVHQAEGSLFDPGVQIVGRDGKPVATGGAPNFGTNWTGSLSAFTVRQGVGPTADDQIAIDAKTFNDQGLHLGQKVTVLSALPPRQFTVVGSLGFGAADNLAGATITMFNGHSAQQVLGKPGKWDTVEIVAASGVSPEQLQQRVSQAIPPAYRADTAKAVAADAAKGVANGLGFIRIFLGVFAGVALFVGAFIIYNTFSILVTQRSRELALLRALGASRKQVNASVLAEAAVVGLFASAVGVVAGVLLAIGIKALFSALGISLPAGSMVLLPRTVLYSVAVGFVVTLVSAIVPARRAARVPPVAAMSENPTVAASSLRARSLSGAIVGFVGGVALSVGLFIHPAHTLALVGVGAALIFIGVAMLSPVVTGPMARILGAPIAAIGRMTGKLSQQNAMRNPRRTASTASALMVGVALVAVMATLGSTLSATFARIIDGSVKADYIVSPKGRGGPDASFSAAVAKDLAARPELVSVAAERTGMWQAGTSTKELRSIDPATAPAVINIDMKSGQESSLANGQVLVSTKEAATRHLKVGDTLDMAFGATGVQHVIVGGTFAPNVFLSSYLISNALYAQNYPNPLDSEVFIKAKSGISQASLDTINAALAPYVNVEVKTKAQFNADQNARFTSLLNFVYILLAFSIFIALIGIVNTLALSVIERTRELGLLRAVGMKRRQVRRMIRGEAVVVCLIGAILGVVVGLGLGLALIAAIPIDGTKVIAIPYLTLTVILVLAGLAGLVAAVWPARRAAKLNVLTAIATT